MFDIEEGDRACGARPHNPSRGGRLLAIAVLCATTGLTAAGCAASGAAAAGAAVGVPIRTAVISAPTATPAPAVTPLPTTGRFDYQLGGGYRPPAGVTIVTRDSTDTPVAAAGTYNICYVNGFQTQSQDRTFWLKKHPSLILHRVVHERTASGKTKSVSKPVTDPGWPDEMLLNSSTAKKRSAIAAIMATTIKLCASKGFQAVEFDNLDSYTRSHHKLTLHDNVALATLYVASAHRDGLAAGQKNTTELGSTGRDTIGFDFAVAEECYRYDECSAYTKVYGASVLDIEYTDDLRGTFAAACADPNTPALTILRDRDLTTPTSKHYVYRACPART